METRGALHLVLVLTAPRTCSHSLKLGQQPVLFFATLFLCVFAATAPHVTLLPSLLRVLSGFLFLLHCRYSRKVPLPLLTALAAEAGLVLDFAQNFLVLRCPFFFSSSSDCVGTIGETAISICTFHLHRHGGRPEDSLTPTSCQTDVNFLTPFWLYFLFLFVFFCLIFVLF